MPSLSQERPRKKTHQRPGKYPEENTMTVLWLAGIVCVSHGLEIESWSLAKRWVRNSVPFLDDAASRDYTQNLKGRIYANKTKISKLFEPITSDELFTPTRRQDKHTLWITAPYRISVISIAFAVYPTLITGARGVLEESMKLEGPALTQSFGPPVSLLYGAWLSITFSILEERITSLQRTATEESALLSSLARRTTLLVANVTAEHHHFVEDLLAPIFQQTTTMASRSREEEMILIANDDVFERYERALAVLTGADPHFCRPSQVDATTDLIDRLIAIRSVRLSKETSALPAAHFVVLSVFSFQLIGLFVYASATSPTPPDDLILRVAFAFFSSIFLLVFNFAIDLNDPFRGNYQIRRSAINANLLSARRRISCVVGEATTKKWLDQF